MNELQKEIAEMERDCSLPGDSQVIEFRKKWAKQYLQMLRNLERELGSDPSEEEMMQALRRVRSEFWIMQTKDKTFYDHLYYLMSRADVETLLLQIITWYNDKEISGDELFQMAFSISQVEIFEREIIDLRIRNLLEPLLIKHTDYERIGKDYNLMLHIAVNFLLPNLLNKIKNSIDHWMDCDTLKYNRIERSVECAERDMQYMKSLEKDSL